jgi:hypothetical protein
MVGAGLAMTLVLVGVSSLAVVNRLASRTVVEDHDYHFTGKAISMQLGIGEVEVVPSIVEDQISVRRRLTYGLSRPFVEERIDGDTFVVRDGDCEMPLETACRVRWLLRVPPTLHLSITTNAGDITVQGAGAAGISGAVHLVSDSGDVRARGLTGPAVQLLSDHGAVSGTGLRSAHVVATSETGDISLSFRSAPKLVQGKTGTGSVEVVVPDGNEVYKVSADAGGGKTIAVKRPEPDDSYAGGRRVIVESKTGPVTVRDVSATAEEEDQTPIGPGS